MTHPDHFPGAVTKLTRDLQRLSWTVDELSDKHDKHDERLDELESDDRVATLQREVSDLQEETEALDSGLTEAQKALTKLTGQVEWLGHHVRLAQGLQPIDLEDLGTELRRLAARARTAQTARAVLLTDTQRAAHDRVITSYKDAGEQLRRFTNAALACSKDLATTPPGSKEHNQAAIKFRSARSHIARVTTALTQQRAQYQLAQEELDADDANKEVYGPRIMTGEHARTTLRSKLREVLGQAVADRALFPVWFTTSLGWGPPAKHADAWLDIAAEVLTYRLCYDITDQVSPLGPRPGNQLGHTPRRGWYDQITKRLDRHPVAR